MEDCHSSLSRLLALTVLVLNGSLFRNLTLVSYWAGADPGYQNGGDKVEARGARAKILLINIHYSLKSIDFIA